MILVDAFPKTYFSQDLTPFIYSMSRDGFSTHIEPLFAFEGIETTMFTGMWPNVHNVWTEFRYACKTTRTKEDWLLEIRTRTMDLLPSDLLKSRLRFAVERYLFHRLYRTPNLIPASAMSYFEPSMPRGIIESNALDGVKTAFDFFRRGGIRFVFIEPWISGDSGVLGKVKKEVKANHKFPFWYIKLNNLDHLGHKFGPVPSMFRDGLAETDFYVEQVVTLLQKENPKLNVLVLTDHGMSKVNRSVDILQDLRQLKSRMYQDYVLFVDSTMVRFWFFDDRAKQEVCDFLSQTNFGHILNSKEKEFLKIPSDPRYGTLIYALDEGYVFHPCFFHSRSLMKGMHGYAYPRTSEAVPMLIMNAEMARRTILDEGIDYTKILPLLMNSLCPGISASNIMGGSNL